MIIGYKQKEWAFPCDVEEPYTIILNLLGRETEVMQMQGEVCTLFSPTTSDNNHLSKMIFLHGLTLQDVSYAIDVCKNKDIVDIKYMFGILNNILEFKGSKYTNTSIGEFCIGKKRKSLKHKS